VRIENFVEGGDARSAETADLRLFRRRHDLPRLFVGRLHPHFHPEVIEAVRREGLDVLPSDVVLRHYADPTPLGPAKLRFNARLLEAELHDRPGQLHYLIEYGRTLLMMDDPRGHDVLAEAATQVMGLRDLPSRPSMKVQVLLTYLLTAPTEKLKANVPYEDARELAVRWFPNSPNLLWTLAEQAFRRKDYANAAQHLQRLLHLGRSGAYDRSHRFDPGILGDESLVNLGACYLQMKKLDEAEACFVQLTTHPKFGKQAANMLALSQKWRREGARPR
jgi:tetratricopeptide (TPR) repeat protein